MDINFKDILLDYENLIMTQVKIPLNTRDVITIEFKRNHLPHLLGLNYLVDIPILFEYSSKRISAIEIFEGIKYDLIDHEAFKQSKYYEATYKDKICHFSSERILCLLKNVSILKFDPTKIKNFDTKLDKLDYLFYEFISCNTNKYSHFGIGFSCDDNENYPNTFFVRDNKDYINDQPEVYASSLYIKDRNNNIFFKIYWNNIRKSLQRTKHYKELFKLQSIYNFDTMNLTKNNLTQFDNITNIDDLNNIKKHFRLLRLDEVKEVYKPYIDTTLWNNSQKQYLIDLIDNSNEDYLPNKIKKIINTLK